MKPSKADQNYSKWKAVYLSIPEWKRFRQPPRTKTPTPPGLSLTPTQEQEALGYLSSGVKPAVLARKYGVKVEAVETLKNNFGGMPATTHPSI